MKTRTRFGFTLIEVLVLFALIAFAIGLLLPMIQRLREAAARMQSQNNLKQIAIACHNYHDANKSLPSGIDMNGFSAAAHLLPYIEQEALYKQIQFNIPARAQANQLVAKNQIKTFLSPQDPSASLPRSTAPTSYLFSAGTKYSLDNNNGAFFRNSKISLVQIPDGTSNTVMLGETLMGDGAKIAVDVKRQHVELDSMELLKLNDNSGVQEFANGKNIASNRCFSWIQGQFLQGTFTGTRTINDTKPDVNCAGSGGLSSLRSLSGGVNVAICDGSVRFVSQSISMQTWQAACTRDGGEVLGNDW